MRPPRRYASYCANIARTLFVDPNKQQEVEYAAVHAAHTAAIAALVEGAPMSAAYAAAVSTLKVSTTTIARDDTHTRYGP